MKKQLLNSAIAVICLMINNWSIAQTNTFFGIDAGTSISSGTWNSFFGRNTGNNTTTGAFNTFIGGQAGFNNITGTHNTMVGINAGYDNTIGINNTFVGLGSGQFNTSGNSNTSLGTYSGYNNSTGEGNIFIGFSAGFNEAGSNKLYIESSSDNIPLIYGDFATDGVGINTKEVAGYTLSVNGKVRATEVKVYTDWADFVFEADYPLPTLAEVANHIKTKGHLTGIPSADEVAKEGIYLGKMNAKLLQKIEELTLYIIQQENRLNKQSELIEQLQQQESRLNQQVELIKRIQTKLK
ncbi:MAG: hypothetical protein AAGI07_03635 [Bacteroidota bacterium]